MLKSTKLKNTLLVGATAILVSCGGQKEIKMGSYAYDAQFLKDHGIEYTELVSADGILSDGYSCMARPCNDYFRFRR